MAEQSVDPKFDIDVPWDPEQISELFAGLNGFLQDEFEVFLAIMAFIVIQFVVLNIYWHLAAYIVAERPQEHVHVLGKEVAILIVLLFVFWYPTTEQLSQLLETQGGILGPIKGEGTLAPAGAIWLLVFIPMLAATMVAVFGLIMFVIGLTRYQASWERAELLTSAGPDPKALIIRSLAVFAFCFITLGFQFVFYVPQIEVVFG